MCEGGRTKADELGRSYFNCHVFVILTCLLVLKVEKLLRSGTAANTKSSQPRECV